MTTATSAVMTGLMPNRGTRTAICSTGQAKKSIPKVMGLNQGLAGRGPGTSTRPANLPVCRWVCPAPFKILPSTLGSLPHLSTTAKDHSATARSEASRNGSESTFRKGP
jgi:hypothetical protein